MGRCIFNMHCSKCGAQQNDDAKFCSNCGNNFNSEATSFNQPNQFAGSTNYSNFNSTNFNSQPMNPKDNPSNFAGVVSCCFPIVGLILYFLWRDEKPNSSKRICYWMIGGIVAYVVIYIIFLVMAFSFSSDIYY